MTCLWRAALPLILLAAPLSANAAAPENPRQPPVSHEPGSFTYDTTANGTEIRITGHSDPTGDLTIPDTIDAKPVTSIADGAFSGSRDLESVSIPDSVSSIGNNTFGLCGKLKSVSIGAQVSTFSTYIFRHSGQLAWFDVSPANPHISSIDGIVYNKDRSILLACPEGRTGSLELPDGILEIDGAAFALCSGLTSITLPEGLETIGYNAFSYCEGLRSITFPESLSQIASRAFKTCRNLKSAHFLGNAPTLGFEAFYTLDPEFSFLVQYGATGFAFPKWRGYPCAYVPELLYTTARAGLTITGHSAPPSVLKLPGSIGGRPVVAIGPSAFAGHPDLASVTIPASVTKLGANAFAQCTGLKNVTFKGQAPQSGATPFAGCPPVLRLNYHDRNRGFTWPLWKGVKTQALGREIAVFQSNAKPITNRKGLQFIGRARPKQKNRSKSFTIRNIGTTPLSRISLSLSGAAKADFRVTGLRNKTLKPGRSMTFNVIFTPRKTGYRNARIRIRSNDSNENPFLIKITGIGL